MCYGCWACYNKCPTKAIYTGTFRGICHYPEPLPAVKVKLRA
jgi:Fe-S-cluster-containing hydrogenase component 2